MGALVAVLEGTRCQKKTSLEVSKLKHQLLLIPPIVVHSNPLTSFFLRCQKKNPSCLFFSCTIPLFLFQDTPHSNRNSPHTKRGRPLKVLRTKSDETICHRTFVPGPFGC